jgi:hypothetical protein
MGLYEEAPLNEGFLKEWKVSKLTTPRVVDTGDVMYELPFDLKEVTMGEAKRFSRKRKHVYKSSEPFDTTFIDFVMPKIRLNKKYKPSLTSEARNTPLFSEVKSLILLGRHTGKLVSCLSENEAKLAVNRQKFAVDPFYARATGGYSVITTHRTQRGPYSELLDLTDVLFSHQLVSSNYAYDRRKVIPHVTWANCYDDHMTYRPKSPDNNEGPDLTGQDILTMLLDKPKRSSIIETHIVESDDDEGSVADSDLDYEPLPLTNFLSVADTLNNNNLNFVEELEHQDDVQDDDISLPMQDEEVYEPELDEAGVTNDTW